MPHERDEQPVARSLKQRIGFWLGLVLFAIILSRPPTAGMSVAARRVIDDETRSQATRYSDATLTDLTQRRTAAMIPAAAVTVLVAVWWMTEAIPIPATSLLPMALLPLLGVLPLAEAAVPYADKSIFLYLGGFVIALGMERWGLHRRIALHVVHRIGTSRQRIVLAFMLATAGLSMWISNTATTLMMLPIALAVLGSLDASDTGNHRTQFGSALMLGICYSASIGGLATPIGTPPNIAFLGQFHEMFPDAPPITFGAWMLSVGPFTAVFLTLGAWILTRVTCRVPRGADPRHRAVINEEYRRLGRMTGPQQWIAAIGAATALLWITRGSLRSDQPGWLMLLTWLMPDRLPPDQIDAYVDDTTVALLMAMLLFIIPGGRDDKGRRIPLMNWETAVRLPWGILLLFGGGYAIARAFRYTGLSVWIGQLLAEAELGMPLAWVAGSSSLMTFLTEITSNTATTQVMLPVLKETALAVGVHPLALLMPATLAASCAFMLPVATPPNAIVFASGKVTMGRMVASGFVFNVMGIILLTAMFWFWTSFVLGIDPGVNPPWATGSS